MHHLIRSFKGLPQGCTLVPFGNSTTYKIQTWTGQAFVSPMRVSLASQTFLSAAPIVLTSQTKLCATPQPSDKALVP